MSKVIEVNGIQVLVDKDKLDELREMFKENVQIDDLDDWTVNNSKVYF